MGGHVVKLFNPLPISSNIWQHFSPEGEPATALTETAYLITTSTGEVGVDLDAEHAVADLTILDSMIQRSGRVNRRGESDRSQIEVVYSEKAKAGADLAGRQKMINALRRLQQGHEPADLDLPGEMAAFGISGGMRSLFSTHPPLEDRIAALEAQKY